MAARALSRCVLPTVGLVGAAAASLWGGDPSALLEPELSRKVLARQNSQRFTDSKTHYSFVIIGAGTAALAGMEAIRAARPGADILLISDEGSLPRVDLEDEGSMASLGTNLRDSYNEWRRHISSQLAAEPDVYAAEPVTLLLGRSDMHLDVEEKKILMHDGSTISFDKCLISTAGVPRDFYVLNSHHVSYALRDSLNVLASLTDFEVLDHAAREKSGKNIMVVGGGFLGTEVALALATDPAYGASKVTQVFVEGGVLHRHLPSYMSEELTAAMRAVGVDVRPERLVTGIRRSVEADCAKATSNNDNAAGPAAELSAVAELRVALMGWEREWCGTDMVVLASTKIQAEVAMTADSGLEIDESNGGVVVNAALEAYRDVYVAGNAASFFDSVSGLGRRRIDAYDHAVNSGLCAGRNMAALDGKVRRYTHQPMFRSAMPGIGLLMEGVGEVDSALETVGVWIDLLPVEGKREPPPPSRGASGGGSAAEHGAACVDGGRKRGVVYYLRENRVVGVLLVNASECLASLGCSLRINAECSTPHSSAAMYENENPCTVANEYYTPEASPRTCDDEPLGTGGCA